MKFTKRQIQFLAANVGDCITRIRNGVMWQKQSNPYMDQLRALDAALTNHPMWGKCFTVSSFARYLVNGRMARFNKPIHFKDAHGTPAITSHWVAIEPDWIIHDLTKDQFIGCNIDLDYTQLVVSDLGFQFFHVDPSSTRYNEVVPSFPVFNLYLRWRRKYGESERLEYYLAELVRYGGHRRLDTHLL